MEKESLLSIIKEAIEDYPSLVSLLTGTKEYAEEENAAITFERLCSEGFIYFENDHEEPFSAENKCCLYVACDNETLRITILCPHDKWIIDGITQRPIEIASLLFKGIHGKKSIQSGTLYFWNGDSNPINDEIGSFWVLFGTQDYLDKSRSNPFTEHNLIAAEVLKRFVNDETISTIFALQGNQTERIKKLCDDGILSLSQYPGIKNRIKIIFSIECPDYIVSWDVLGQHEEDLLWTISDTIENIMHSFPGAKVLRRGELISLTDDIQSCSSAFNFSYSAESLYETVSEKERIRVKPNFFCDIDVMNVLINREIPENVPEMDFTVSLIELPLWLSFSHDDNNWIFKVYSQHEMFNRDESLASEKGHLVVDKETGEGSGSGREELKDAITLFFKACQSLSIFIREEGIEKHFSRLDPDKSGILLSVRDGKIVYKVVSGKERPDLTCETLTGEVVQGRPYSEDFWERSYYDLKSWDDLIELANEGDIQAMDKVAMAYLNGGDVIHEEVEPDPEKAVLWFEKMADAGSSNGMFNLGLHYAKGYGVKRDFKKAAEWMKRALLAGDQDAERLVGEYSRLAECLRLAEEGDAEAQADLAAGYMSLGGSLEQAGVGEDYKESVKWAQLAADQGNGDGLWTLALAYEHGRGVEKDIEKAVRYYEQGAELGHSKCQHSLGCYYIRGEIVPEDHRKAFDLFLKSAEQGYGLAMRDVGRCYQFGTGTMGNMKKAVEWYEKACDVLDDPELAEKTKIFKSMSEFDEHWGEDYPGDFDENCDPDSESDIDPDLDTDKYMTGIVPDEVSAAWRYEDELDREGYLPDELHGDSAWKDLPRVHQKAAEGDKKAVEILNALNEL